MTSELQILLRCSKLGPRKMWAFFFSFSFIYIGGILVELIIGRLAAKQFHI